MPFAIYIDHDNQKYRDNNLRGYASQWRDTHVTAHSAGLWGNYRIGLVEIEDHVVKLQLSGETVRHLFEELACIDHFKECLKPEYLESMQKEVASRRRNKEQPR